jgi:hypothetical protein
VNARDNTPLRTLIANRLSAGEDTAVGIASAIGKGDTPSIVVKELNAMRTDGQVECEQRGKNKELVYWLAVPLEVAAGNVAPGSPDDRTPAIISESVLPAGMRQGTRAAQIYRVLPAFDEQPIDARAIATTTGCAKALIDGALWAMVKAGQCVRHTNGGPYGYTRLPPAGGDIDTQNAQPEVAKNTGSSASGSLSPSEGAAVQSKPAPVAAATPSAAPVAADVKPLQYDPRSVAFSASARPDAEKDEEYSLLGLLADIRAAAGDHEGKLMQDELVERVRETARARAIAQVDLDTIRATLRPLVYTGDPAHAPGPVKSAEHAAQWIQSLGETNREQLAGIVAASETLAPLVPGDIDTADMDLQEIAERVAAGVADLTARLENKDEELLKQAAVVVDLRSQLETLQREATCLSRRDRYTATGYLVRASKRKPRTLLDKDKARDAALSSIRAGAQRAEVFALVPIGQARRGVEWRSA